MEDDRELAEFFYVDDSADELFLLRYRMAQIAFELSLTAFSDAQAALDELKSRLMEQRAMPVVVVIDLYMPMMDGSMFVRRVRATPGLENIRVAVCSGSDDATDKARSMEAGADAFLGKPLDLPSLLSMLRD